MSRKVELKEDLSYTLTLGTGPLACLSLFPVAELVRNMFEINYSQLIQYEILEKLVTCIS